MNIKQKTGRFFKSRKANVFLLFMVLALLFSMLTKLSKDYTKTIAFQIQPVNVPEDKLIIKDTSHLLQVDLKTYGFKLLRYYFIKPTIKLDLTDVDKDEEHFIWTEKKAFSKIIAQFESNVTIANINPDTLKLRYDTNAVKMIPVVLDSKIEFVPGYDVADKYRLEPDSVKVIGPKIILDSIFNVRTDQVVLKDVNTSISKMITLNLPINEQLRFSHEDVKVNAKVEKFTEGTIDVPIIVRNIPENIKLKIYPKSVAVLYYASLSDYNSIASNGFIVECDYNDLKANTSYLTARLIQKPEHIRSARLSVSHIEFILSQ